MRFERTAIASVYAGGLLAMVLGLLLQFTAGGDALSLGLVFFFVSNVAIGVWRMARPRAVEWPQRSRLTTILFTIASAFFAILLSMPLWVKSS